MRNPSKRHAATHMGVVRGGRDKQEIALADGAKVVVRGGAVAELRDAEERLLVRYENVRAEITAPAGARNVRAEITAPAGARIVPSQAKVFVAP
jgi:hypothetical protein